ncbi:MAG: hypothetical protein L0H15_08010, partial [Nitrosospira sp.]|nr:hypothetical protein [Nitrosospira sp.]
MNSQKVEMSRQLPDLGIMQPITILQALHRARQDIGDPDARMLLPIVLNVSPAHLIAHSDQE